MYRKMREAAKQKSIQDEMAKFEIYMTLFLLDLGIELAD